MNNRVQQMKEEYEHEAFLLLLEDDIYIETEDELSDGQIGNDDDEDEDEPIKLYQFRDEIETSIYYLKYALDNKTKAVRKRTQVRLGRGRMADRPISQRDKEALEWKAKYEHAARDDMHRRE
jgi:hypothetical protein